MSAEEPTSDGNQREDDARMLADLRQWRHSPRVSAKLAAGEDAYLSVEEIDMLLRIADERDALRRQATDMPDETPRQRWEASRTPITIQPGQAIVHGEIVPLPTVPDLCVICGEEIRMLGATWLHVGAPAVYHRPTHA